MPIIVALGPPKKGNKMKKKEEIMLEDDGEMMSDMDMEEEEYDDLEDTEDPLNDEDDEDDEEDGLFGPESDDADLELFVEDIMSSFEAKDVKGVLNGLRDFIRSVVDK
jgi:hypothetical protein